MPRPIPPADLSAFLLLSHRVLPQDWMDWPEWFDAIGWRLPQDARIVHFDSFPLVLQAAVAGQGIALGWRRTVTGLIDEGKLIRASRRQFDGPRKFRSFAAHDGAITPKLKRFSIGCGRS